MKHININGTNLQITPINLGGNVFGWTLNEEESFNILDKFIEFDGNFIDTANTYAWWINQTGGQSETIIGKWMKQRNIRSKIVLATKVGSQTALHPQDISRQHILQEIDTSLKRLQTDYIDIYYTHFDDQKTPVEETISTYNELIRAGKVRYIAASNISIGRLEESLEFSIKNNLPKYIAIQPHYNLMERNTYENKIRFIAEKHKLSVFPYYSLASGFLSGKYQKIEDFNLTARGKGLKHYFNERGQNVIKALDKISQDHKVQIASVALAWLLAQPTVSAPVVSATNNDQLKAIFDAVNLNLTTAEIEQLNKVSNENK